MKIVNMHEAKTTLSALVAEAQAGEEVVIARGGKPVAKVVPYQPTIEREPGVLHRDPNWANFVYDPVVFAPMTDAEAEAEGWL